MYKCPGRKKSSTSAAGCVLHPASTSARANQGCRINCAGPNRVKVAMPLMTGTDCP